MSARGHREHEKHKCSSQPQLCLHYGQMKSFEQKQYEYDSLEQKEKSVRTLLCLFLKPSIQQTGCSSVDIPATSVTLKVSITRHQAFRVKLFQQGLINWASAMVTECPFSSKFQTSQLSVSQKEIPQQVLGISLFQAPSSWVNWFLVFSRSLVALQLRAQAIVIHCRYFQQTKKNPHQLLKYLETPQKTMWSMS